MHEPEYSRYSPPYQHRNLPRPTIDAVAPPNDEIRRLIRDVLNGRHNPTPSRIKADLEHSGHGHLGITVEMIQGVMNGL